jgi:hypothetical protein
MPQYRVFVEKLIDAKLVEKFSTCMEPDGSLPCSQKLVTELYPEPIAFSQLFYILFL